MKKILITCVLFGLTSACSSYVYKEEVKTFSDSVTSVYDSYDKGLKEIENAARLSCLRDTASAISRPGQLRLQGACQPGQDSSGSGDPCTIVNLSCETADVPEVRRAKAYRPKITVLKDYAKALEKIVDSSDREALVKAQSDFVASCASFQTAAGISGCSQFQPVANIVNNIIIANLDRQRFLALKEAVNASHGDVTVIASALDETLSTISLQRQRRLAVDMETRITNPAFYTQTRSDYLEALSQLQKDAALYNAITKARAAKVSPALIEAHLALKEAVNSNRAQIEPVREALEAFQTQADALSEAF
jgi:hypothetical protein